ncbi:hypothetical protein LZ554_001306 [Drepanopeziza brunnea f. sp. 'monogermtubi']|nr:hypothetical protein LZ554_001306 [Drepanopeziza brunnea f. sp. 'monogermtubi']
MESPRMIDILEREIAVVTPKKQSWDEEMFDWEEQQAEAAKAWAKARVDVQTDTQNSPTSPGPDEYSPARDSFTTPKKQSWDEEMFDWEEQQAEAARAWSGARVDVQTETQNSPTSSGPDEYSPDEYSPDEDSPDEDSPDEYSPDEYSPDDYPPPRYSFSSILSTITEECEEFEDEGVAGLSECSEKKQIRNSEPKADDDAGNSEPSTGPITPVSVKYSEVDILDWISYLLKHVDDLEIVLEAGQEAREELVQTLSQDIVAASSEAIETSAPVNQVLSPVLQVEASTTSVPENKIEIPAPQRPASTKVQTLRRIVVAIPKHFKNFDGRGSPAQLPTPVRPVVAVQATAPATAIVPTATIVPATTPPPPLVAIQATVPATAVVATTAIPQAATIVPAPAMASTTSTSTSPIEPPSAPAPQSLRQTANKASTANAKSPARLQTANKFSALERIPKESRRIPGEEEEALPALCALDSALRMAAKKARGSRRSKKEKPSRGTASSAAAAMDGTLRGWGVREFQEYPVLWAMLVAACALLWCLAAWICGY